MSNEDIFNPPTTHHYSGVVGEPKSRIPVEAERDMWESLAGRNADQAESLRAALEKIVEVDSATNPLPIHEAFDLVATIARDALLATREPPVGVKVGWGRFDLSDLNKLIRLGNPPERCDALERR